MLTLGAAACVLLLVDEVGEVVAIAATLLVSVVVLEVLSLPLELLEPLGLEVIVDVEAG